MDVLARLGPFTLLVAILAFAGFLVLFAAFVLSLRGRRVSAPAWALPASLAATVGLTGGWLGVDTAVAVATQGGDTLGVSLVAAGAAIALEPALAGCAAAGGLALLAAWLLALTPILRRAVGTRWSWGHALVPALLAAGGAPVLGRFAGPWAALFALVGAFPCVLVALRCSERGLEEPEPGRVVGATRLAVFLLAPLGTLALAQALRIHAAMGLFRAVGFASVETKTSLMAAVRTQAMAPAAVLAVLVVIAAGAAVVAPVARSAWDRRAVVGAVVVLLLVAPPLGARSLLMDGLARVRQAARPWYEDRVTELATRGLELPRSTAHRTPERMLTLSAAPQGLAVDELPLPWEAEVQDGLHWPLFRALDSHAVQQADLGYGAVAFQGLLLLQVHGELSWEQVEPLLRTAVGARFFTAQVAVASPDRELRVLELELDGEIHPSAGSTPPPQPSEVAPAPAVNRFVSLTLGSKPTRDPVIALEALDGVWRLTAPGLEPELARDAEELTEAAYRIKSQYPDEEDVLVRPVPSTTWAELVAALDAVRGSGTVKDPVFPYPTISLRGKPQGEPDEVLELTP